MKKYLLIILIIASFCIAPLTLAGNPGSGTCDINWGGGNSAYWASCSISYVLLSPTVLQTTLTYQLTSLGASHFTASDPVNLPIEVWQTGGENTCTYDASASTFNVVANTSVHTVTVDVTLSGTSYSLITFWDGCNGTPPDYGFVPSLFGGSDDQSGNTELFNTSQYTASSNPSDSFSIGQGSLNFDFPGGTAFMPVSLNFQ
jgi:hypothetical protein